MAPISARFARVRLVGTIALLLVWPVPSIAQSRMLPIPPVTQATPVWCWAAVGEMVFRHYKVPSINPAGHYQCGIVGGLGGPCWADCRRCVIPAGQMSNIASMIEGYPALVQEVTRRRVRQLVAANLARPLEPEDVIDQIRSRRPIVAGISPSGMSYPDGLAEHVALIIGYTGDAGKLVLIVNDPFPFAAVGAQDPYLSAGGERMKPGRYKVRYGAFVNRLKWTDTLFDID